MHIYQNNLLYQTESAKTVRFCVNNWKKSESGKIELDQDANYDVELAVQNVHEYIKHFMRYSQQKKAKSEAFDKLGESAEFRLQIFFKI